ncbi:MAG: hypothetical protein ACTS1Z_13795 [Parasphingopyxis sp.]|uniref:hypothetical protein n=1 Tax=Parasphingopyxis sp. TaxID=1920299 RepID=UPI003F9FBFCC
MTVAVNFAREGNPENRIRIAELLTRYPQLDDGEMRELIQFYRTAPAIDTALLTCDESIGVQITAFQREFRRQISRGGDASLALLVYGAFAAALAFAIVPYL